MAKKVLKEDGTKRLIDQILASLRVGKIAVMDKMLNINSSNPVENKVITQAINTTNANVATLAGRVDNMTSWEYAGVFTYDDDPLSIAVEFEDDDKSLIIITGANEDSDAKSGLNKIYLINKNIIGENEGILIGGDTATNWNLQVDVYSNMAEVKFTDASTTSQDLIVDVWYQRIK